MLKNDGTLPLAKGSKVSVLGVAQDCLQETTGTITESLTDAGFKVNPTLESKYLSDSATWSNYGSETALTGQERASISQYSDAAVIVIGRGSSGESADQSRNTGEPESDTYLGTETGWTHEAHESADNVEYKHALQLTESEEDMIALAEELCDKVIVLYTSSYTFEMQNLQDDKDINAILWIGRLGRGGIGAVGEILCGDVNPSGKTVDEWTRDFTNDPTYANTFESAYTDSNGNGIYLVPSNRTSTMGGNSGLVSGNFDAAAHIDYEEDIYLGYKWYETYWKEATDQADEQTPTASPKINGTTASADEWYDYNVVYPMGYGESYTTFSFESMTLTTDGNATIAEGGALTASSVKTLYAEVEVKNTGDVAGKETVQIYVEAPYGNVFDSDSASDYQTGIEKSYITLVGYAKTDLIPAGGSDTVTVAFNVQDFASFDYWDANNDGQTGYELDPGTYTVHAMESSSHENMTKETGVPYKSQKITIGDESSDTKATLLSTDDYSGNSVKPLFSTDPKDTANAESDQSDFYSMWTGEETGSMISPLGASNMSTSGTTVSATMLSRSNFDGTAPTAPTAAQNKLSSDLLAQYTKYDYIDADDSVGDLGEDGYSDEGYIWAKDASDIPTSWTQGAGVIDSSTGMYATTFADMAGVALYDESGDVSTAWVNFMNQLTYDEMTEILNNGYRRRRG